MSREPSLLVFVVSMLNPWKALWNAMFFFVVHFDCFLSSTNSEVVCDSGGHKRFEFLSEIVQRYPKRSVVVLRLIQKIGVSKKYFLITMFWEVERHCQRADAKYKSPNLPKDFLPQNFIVSSMVLLTAVVNLRSASISSCVTTKVAPRTRIF